MNGRTQWMMAGALGALIGATGAGLASAATATPPAYLVVEYEITDRAAFQAYIKAVEAIPTDRVFLARHAKGTALAGTPPKWIGILRYPSLEQALAFERSPAYQALVATRDKGTSWRAYVVEGLAD